MRSFIKDQRGIVAVVAIGIALILATTIMWLVSMAAVNIFWDAISPLMPSNTHGTMTMLNNVGGWVILIEVGGLLGWMGVSAYRKEVVEY